jgi:peptide/nickel transport system ATP-binding protein
VTGAALEADGVSVAYRRPDGSMVTVVSEVSLILEPGRIVGLAGESGCGKSTLALACLGAKPDGGAITSGRILVDGIDLRTATPRTLRSLWGQHLAYLPQHPATALHPTMRVSAQLAAPINRHLGMRGRPLHDRVVALLDQVGIPDPQRALRRYPHEFSGGQQQRIALALALSCDPQVLILDEPTTGLDVTTQARIMALLRDVIARTGTATMHISHDLALLGTVADQLLVMYAGEIVESGATRDVLRDPRHPYTRALLAALPSVHEQRAVRGLAGRPPAGVVTDACAFAPRCSSVAAVCLTDHPILQPLATGRKVRCVRHDRIDRIDTATRPAEPKPTAESTPTSVLEIEELRCQYRKQPAPAVAGISLSITRGDTVAIVGESGSGKSTLLKAIAGLHPPRSGVVRFMGRELAPLARHRPQQMRREIQLVFQDPDSSLNPRHRVSEILSRPIRLFRSDVIRRDEDYAVAAALEEVGLAADVAQRYPDELSGGQRQRVAVARAFVTRPTLLLCDEITSALDVSVQATILELIAELTATFGTAVVFVSHDLAVVRTICRHAVVLRAGRICEEGPTTEIFSTPAHPYTKELIESIPRTVLYPQRGQRLP